MKQNFSCFIRIFAASPLRCYEPMKSFLYLFNPENDMALACGDLYYMAPASARKMAADLSALPGWYAGDGATVLLATKEQVAWMAAAEQVSSI